MSRLEIYFKSDNFQSSSLKIIVNSTEWEITVDMHEFDESWMRYVVGRVSDINNPEFMFHDVTKSGKLL